MKVVQINITCGVGSTGKICEEISKLLTEEKIENYIFYSNKTNGYELGKGFSSGIYIKRQALKSRIFGNYGFNSTKATEKIIEEMERIAPTIVHIHNIHGHDCNLEVLFTYLKQKKINVVWTLHDCWAFTAYCPHFTYAKCDKWKTGCNHCPQIRSYSWFSDKSKKQYERKRKLLSEMEMTIVTPSKWLGDLVESSYLKEQNIKVIQNGIDLDVFRPTENSIRKKYNISEDKKIILGVSFDWGVKKGLDVLIELAKRLNSEKYQIILVGTTEDIDKRIPSNIITIHKTQNAYELAELYTVADVFVNPTREEVLGLVNIEALACGTPIVAFNTGGCPEVVTPDTGEIVDCEDIDEMEKAIIRMCNKRYDLTTECIKQAQKFNSKNKFQEYIEVYKALEQERR